MNDPVITGIAAGLAVALLWLIVLQVRMGRMLKTYRQLLGGTKPGNLEQIMTLHVGRINEHERILRGLTSDVGKLDDGLQLAVQRVGLVRFNPFEETGGDQSFAIALLNDHGDGVVVTSLHNRVETRVYAKPVEEGHSTYALSDEESQAILQSGWNHSHATNAAD